MLANNFIHLAPGVADLAAAGNWANEYLQAEVHATDQGGDWSTEFVDNRPVKPAPVVNARWAQEYLDQTESANWLD